MDIIDFAWRPLYLVLRFLLWLAWDFLVWSIAWGLGWPVWRALTLGRFPHVGIRDYEDAGVLEAFLVCGTGLAVLGAALWFTHARVMGG